MQFMSMDAENTIGRALNNLITVGKCNRCGLRKQLTYRGSVCSACSAMFDREWRDSSVADWILVTTCVTASQRRAVEILEELKRHLAKAKGQPEPEFPTGEKQATLHIFRNTAYSEMKTYWAAGKPSDGKSFGEASAEEQAQIRSLLAKRPECDDAAFLRPATAVEIEQHNTQLRKDARDKVIVDVFEKWGFGDEGQPLDPNGDAVQAGIDIWDIQQRRKNAHEEIERTLRQLELSE